MGLFGSKSSSKSTSTSYAYDQRSIADGNGIAAPANSGALARYDGGLDVFAPQKGITLWQVAAIAGGMWVLTRPQTKAFFRKAFKWRQT